MKFLRYLPMPALLLLVLLPGPTHAAAPLSMTVAPANIHMGARFDGTTLTVSGTVPAGSDVILRFTGAPEDLHLRQKGKVFGLLWMNTGTVHLKNVPKICLLDSSRPLTELGAAGSSLELAGLKSDIAVEKGGNAEESEVIHELLLLKKHDHLYSERTNSVVLGPDTADGRTFTAGIRIPSAVAPAHYTLELFAVHDGAISSRQTTDVTAELTGFPRWLSTLAFSNGLLYGILATIIAVVSGLAIGLVFQSKGAH